MVFEHIESMNTAAIKFELFADSLGITKVSPWLTLFSAFLTLSALLLNVFYASFLRRTCRLGRIENGPIRHHSDKLVLKADVHCQHLWLSKTEAKMSGRKYSSSMLFCPSEPGATTNPASWSK